MSEQVQETEVVAGVISGVNQRAVDKWQIAVTPAGSQYAKNIWTKDAENVRQISDHIGEAFSFVCNVSHWTNNEGKPVRSLWLKTWGTPMGEGAAPVSGGEVAAPAVATASPAQPNSTRTPQESTDVDWDEKERRAIRSKAWAHTISLLGPHISGTDFDAAIAMKLHSEMKLMVELIYVDICRSHDFAHPALGQDTPFGEDFQPPFD